MGNMRRDICEPRIYYPDSKQNYYNFTGKLEARFRIQNQNRWRESSDLKQKQCCGSGILFLFGLLLRDPGWVIKSRSGSGVNNPDHISESLETIFLVKNTQTLWCGSGIWNIFDPGSGMEKIRIRDPQLADCLRLGINADFLFFMRSEYLIIILMIIIP